jgi:prepilin-type N-terminal cleavage/methylation domain-containing protein
MISTLAPAPRHGFTLIEILVTISIIAVLVSLLIPGIGLVRNAVRRSETRALIDGLAGAMETYRLVDGRHRFPGGYDDQSLRTADPGGTPDVLDLLRELGSGWLAKNLAPAPPAPLTGPLADPPAESNQMLVDAWRRQIRYVTDIGADGRLVTPFTAPGGAPADWNPKRQQPFAYVWSLGKPTGDDTADALDANVANWIYRGSAR